MWLLLFFIAQTAGLSGTVRDSITGEALQYAHVYLQDTTIGGITDERGFFSIKAIPPGKHPVVVSYVGYKTLVETLDFLPRKHMIRHYGLNPQEIKTEEVVITARRERFREEAIPHLKLSSSSIRMVPRFLEGDLLRSLQVLPGVFLIADFSGRYSVRGGAPQENLTILDGIPLYNPYHLGGIFSTFDLDAIERFDFYRGGYSALRGGALSSLLEAELRSGRKEGFRLTGSLSFLSTKALIEGPILGGSALLSLRRTYFDLILPKIKPDWDFPYHFSDILFKTRREFSKNLELSLAGIWSDDIFDFQDEVKIIWGNRGMSLETRYIKENLLLRGTLAYGAFSSDVEIGDFLSLHNPVSILSLRLDGLLRLRGRDFEGGVELQRLYGRFKNNILGITQDDAGTPYLGHIFTQTTIKKESFILTPGLRFTLFTLKIPERPERNATRVDVEPRLSFKYFLTPDLAIHLGWGIFNQHLVAISGPMESIASFYYWVTVFGKWKPMKAYHYIVGEEILYPWGEVNFDLFYKNYPYLLLYNSEGYDPLDPDNSVFLKGKGESFGLDLRIAKNLGFIQGSLAGSIIFAKGRFGKEESYHPLPWDRRGQLSLSLQIPLGKWRWGLGFTFGGGAPFTGVAGRFRRYFPPPAGDLGEPPDYGGWAEIESAPFGMRYPDYHRLDLLLTRPFKALGTDWEISLSVLNVYNRKNVFIYYYDYSEDPPKRKKISQLPIVPSIEIRGSWK